MSRPLAPPAPGRAAPRRLTAGLGALVVGKVIIPRSFKAIGVIGCDGKRRDSAVLWCRSGGAGD